MESFDRSNHAQIRERSQRVRPDLVWFDGDWEHSAERWRASEIRERLLKDNPGVIINSRLRGYGDYATPEQGVPVTPPTDPYWELCMTMNDSWGYDPDDLNYKSTNQIIRILVDVVSMGGNVLLGIGPREDGSIPEEQTQILEGLGRWTRKHAEAVYATQAGLPPGHYYGPTALSADRSTIYLYVAHRPNGPIMLKGIRNTVDEIRIVGTDASLDWDIKMKLSWKDTPGIIYVDLPHAKLDKEVTVLAVQLDGPVSLYREDRGPLENNE